MKTSACLYSFVMAAAMVATPLAAESEQPCPATRLEDRLPSIIAPMAGDDPVWLVDGSFGRWQGAETLVKSGWVLSGGRASGPFRVRGRQLDGDGVMRFQVGMDGTPSEEAYIEDVGQRSVGPGGASEEIMANYSFVIMYLIFPNPGCWELTADFDGQQRRIVVHETEPAAGR